MNSDLIFHVVSRRKWPTLNKGGVYQPEEYDETGKVTCVEASGLQDYLNNEFKGRKNLLILVIDISRLDKRPKNRENSYLMDLEGGINLDAILDKIRIDCDADGKFNIEVDSK